MAGNVAHDFGNMLQVIFGNLQLAQNQIPSDHPVIPLLQDEIDQAV